MNADLADLTDLTDLAGIISGRASGVSGGVSAGVHRPSARWWRPDPTGRYLMDQDGHPVLFIGDNAHALTVNAALSDVDLYVADRVRKGFTGTWVNLLCSTNTGGRSDSSTFDGLLPFTTPGDLSTPNPAYFERCDAILQRCVDAGLYVFLDPIDTTDYTSTLESNGAATCYAYGYFLGTRYGGHPRIVWLHGDDFQNWNNATTHGGYTDTGLVLQVLAGIKAASPRNMHSAELDYYLSDTLQDANWNGHADLNAVYSYYQSYQRQYVAYNRTVAGQPVPQFLVEANYENTPNGQNAGIETSGTGDIALVVLRRQEWWTMLSGSTGHFYGNRPYIHMNTGGWQSNLGTLSAGETHLQIHKTFMQSIPWWALVPDQTHVVATSGYGTFNADGTSASYSSGTAVTTARTPDGKVIVSYLANATSSGALTIDMTTLATSTITAQWFDPTTGIYSSAGTGLTNSGTHAFTAPGSNAGGDPDFVLLLTAV